MSPHLVLIALLLGPFGAHPGKTIREHLRIGAWTLTVVTDRFSDHRTCRLFSGRMHYERQALVLQLAPEADTANAVYRIDSDDPISVQTDALELARLGFRLFNDDLKNPSGGLVRIPAHKTENAHLVRVEITRGGRVQSFKIDGLSAAIGVAHDASCGDDNFR